MDKMLTQLRMMFMTPRKKAEYIEKYGTRVGERKVKNLIKILYIKDDYMFEAEYRGKVLLHFRSFKNLAEFEQNFAREFNQNFY